MSRLLFDLFENYYLREDKVIKDNNENIVKKQSIVFKFIGEIKSNEEKERNLERLKYHSEILGTNSWKILEKEIEDENSKLNYRKEKIIGSVKEYSLSKSQLILFSLLTNNCYCKKERSCIIDNDIIMFYNCYSLKDEKCNLDINKIN